MKDETHILSHFKNINSTFAKKSPQDKMDFFSNESIYTDLNLMPKIFEQIKTKNKVDVDYVCKYLNCEEETSIIYCILLELLMREENVTEGRICTYLKISSITFHLEIEPFIKKMENKMLIIRTKQNARRGNDIVTKFMLNNIVKTAIIENKEIPNFLGVDADVKDFLMAFDIIFSSYIENEEFNTRQIVGFKKIIEAKINVNTHLSLIKKIKEYKMDILEEILLLKLVCKNYFDNDNKIYSNSLLIALSGNKTEHFRAIQSAIENKEAIIMKENFVSTEDFFFKTDMLYFTNKGHEIFLTEEGLLPSNKKKQGVSFTRLVKHTEIRKVDLFFKPEQDKQVKRLLKIASETNYQNIISELNENLKLQGITAMLYGEPGTGKTETVLQMAAESKRDIFWVEISKLKSAYVGESEKAFKKVFEDYAAISVKMKNTPILFINEADSIIGRRLDASSSVDVMNNTLQNILLEEIEKFSGILIAATNLIKNMDTAFERRFLFKIKYECPSEQVRMKIWKNSFAGLTDEMCGYLAENFELTGAKIENVARKVLIAKVIDEDFNQLESIIDFCKEEIGVYGRVS